MNSPTVNDGLLTIGGGKKKRTLQTANILYLIGDGNYSWIVQRNEGKVLSTITLSQFERALPAFARVHKQFLVNPAYVKRWIQERPNPTERAEVKIRIANGRRIPVARRRIGKTRKLLADLAQTTK